MDKLLLVVHSAPYGTAAVVEGFRYAIGMASLEIDTTVVLCEDGVFTVMPGQDPAALGMKSLGEAYGGIEEFGVKLFVLKEALEERDIDPEAILAGEVIDFDMFMGTVADAEAVVRF